MRDLSFDIKGRDATQAAFDSARRNAQAFNRDLDLTARGMQLASTAAKAFIAGFSVAAIADIGRALQGAVAEAADLVDLADKVGVNTNELQRMIFGFSQAGVQAETVSQSLLQWNKRIGEAYTKGGQLADILKANGVSLTDQNGQLRSSVDLMRDMANLIQNAGSDQERTTLAMEAFGRSGGDMVLALQDGADGMAELMREAERAGGIMEEDILRTAADIDDEFNRISRTVDLNVKSALIGVADVIFQMQQGTISLGEELSRLGNSDFFRRFAQTMGVLDENGQVNPESGLLPPPIVKGDRPGSTAMDRAQEDFDQAFATWAQRQSNEKTIIPNNDNRGLGRTRAASAAREQVSAYERVIEKLREEEQALGLNEMQQRILSEQRRADVSATSEQGKAIASLVTQIETETARLERLEESQRAFNDAMSYVGSEALDAMFAWAEGAATAEEAAKRFGMEILKAVTYGALLGEGPFGGSFGGGSGSVLGGIASMFFGGFRAAGGPVDPWGTYVVGEDGPEILRMGSRGGNVIANDDVFGGGGRGGDTYHIDARGADQAAIARLERGLAERDRNFGKMVDGRMDTRQTRRTRG